MVSNRIFEFDLRPAPLAVYCCLSMHRNQATNSCFPSRETIARECRIGVRTVDECIRTLCDVGLITKEHRHGKDGGYISNHYTFAPLLEVAEELDSDSGLPGTPVTVTPSPRSTRSGVVLDIAYEQDELNQMKG